MLEICDPYHNEMSIKGDFCDDFNQIYYLEQGIIGKYASAPSVSNESFDLICISSGGNLHMNNMTPLPIVLFCLAFLTAEFALICDSQQYKVL
jgi:hypothetical protein